MIDWIMKRVKCRETKRTTQDRIMRTAVARLAPHISQWSFKIL